MSDVTASCTSWQSDTASVVTVSSAGLLMAHAAGTATITATCNNIAARVVITVSFSVRRVSLSGFAIDAVSGWSVPNVLMQITEGVNAGASARTDAFGEYEFYNLAPDIFALSASGSQAYGPAQRLVILASDTQGVNVALPRAAADLATPYDLTLMVNALTNCVSDTGSTSPPRLAPSQSFTSLGLMVGPHLQYIVGAAGSFAGDAVDLELQQDGTASTGTLIFNLQWPGAFFPDGTNLRNGVVSGAFDANGQFSGTAAGAFYNLGLPGSVDCDMQLGVVLTPDH